MEIAKYAMGLLLIGGCAAPAAEDDLASHQGAEGDAEVAVGVEQRLQEKTNQLGLASLKKKPKKPLDVEFGGCTEFAGLTFVPTENVAGLVPAQFELAHFTTEAEAVVVVRVANCQSVRVKNGKARAGTVAQVGVTLAGADATSDINNYTLWYVTDNRELAHELSKFGVDAEYSRDIDYVFAPDTSGSGAFDITVSAEDAPDYVLAGTATTPTAAAVPFVASWWYETCHGVVQMRTELPQIQFGGSVMSLEAVESALQEIVGTSAVGFPGLDSYNTFAAAEMVVTIN